MTMLLCGACMTLSRQEPAGFGLAVVLCGGGAWRRWMLVQEFLYRAWPCVGSLPLRAMCVLPPCAGVRACPRGLVCVRTVGVLCLLAVPVTKTSVHPWLCMAHGVVMVAAAMVVRQAEECRTRFPSGC